MAEKGRQSERARHAAEWLSRWGFATLVAVGALAAAWVAATVAVPADVPSFALQADPVYRLEVGGSFFAGLYLASTALVLALNNRAFSEIGTTGIRDHGIGGESSDQQRIHALIRSVESIQAEKDDSQEARGYNEPDDN